VTPDTALTAVIARCVAAGMVEARSPLGVMNASQQRVNRSFSVLPQGIGPSSSPGRGRPAVELGHQIKPGDGQEAPSQALSDLHTVMKYISANGTTLTAPGAIIFSPASHAYQGGGAFLITTFTLQVIYELSLVI
jgi:hypothetical protein